MRNNTMEQVPSIQSVQSPHCPVHCSMSAVYPLWSSAVFLFRYLHSQIQTGAGSLCTVSYTVGLSRFSDIIHVSFVICHVAHNSHVSSLPYKSRMQTREGMHPFSRTLFSSWSSVTITWSEMNWQIICFQHPSSMLRYWVFLESTRQTPT